MALGLAPLLLAMLLTLATSALLGPTLNLANIIALPLLFGMGVAFDVYYVMAWKAGERYLLSTAMTRGMLFSTLTTFGAFGTLALSSHPGTASMGVLLTLSLFYVLVAVLLTLPAMLHALARQDPSDVGSADKWYPAEAGIPLPATGRGSPGGVRHGSAARIEHGGGAGPARAVWPERARRGQAGRRPGASSLRSSRTPWCCCCSSPR